MKSKIMFFLLLMLFIVPLITSVVEEASDPSFAKLDQIFGQKGKSLPGGVYKFGWPRSDLHVTMDGVSIEPALALGSWGAFQKTATTGDLMMMGDLALLPSELPVVIEEFHRGDISVLAIHNHLSGETPEVIYVHFEGHGTPDSLAQTLKNAIAKTKTPAPAPAKMAMLTASAANIFDAIQKTLGVKGNMAGAVLQIGVPRQEKIMDNGMEIPPAMGMANSMNFQIAGDRVAATGDFVLIASEVNPVMKELLSHGIHATALHTHMLNDSPHFFFMHFWALDSADKVAVGLKAALSKMNVKSS
jgi:Domain of Unknown Function (DUF1259)